MTTEDAAGDLSAAPAPLRRLTKRAEFLYVAQGISAARGAAAVQARMRPPPAGAEIRVGFTATRKVGGAVVRNRAKRRLREAARQLLPAYATPGCDYVFVARAGTASRPWARFLDDVRSALISLAAGGDGPRPPRGGGRTPRRPSSSPASGPPPASSRPAAPGPSSAS